MRPFAATASALTALSAISCALVLDFDELTGGNGAGTPCTSDLACDDGNPCTEDRCDLQSGKCSSEPHVLVRTGPRRTITGDIGRALRLSMTATGSRFYLSVFYERPNKSRDVSLHYWDAEGEASFDAPPLSQETALVLDKPASVAALVTERTAPPVVHAYVASGDPPAMFHVVMKDDLSVVPGPSRAAETDPSFDASIETRGPIAWQTTDGKVWGSWITTAGTMHLHTGNVPFPAAPTPAFAPSPPPLFLAPLAGGAKPGVMWLSSAGPFVRLQNGSIDTPLTQCNSAGTAMSMSSAYLQFNDAWLSIWTRDAAATGPSLESSLVVCTDSGSCSQAAPDCSADPPPVRAGTRNGAVAFYQRAAKASSAYQFSALPEVDSLGGLARISVRLRELDFSQSTAVSTELELREISRTSLGAQASGPNWPEVAVANENVMSVAWIEPGPENRDVVHWERYQVCYPD